MKLIKYFTYVAIILKCSSSFVEESNKIHYELNIFMDTLKLCPELDNHTCYYTASNFESTKDIANIFIRKIKCASLIVNTNITENFDIFAFEVKYFFIFTETIEEVSSSAETLIDNPLWKPSAYSFFIVTTEVADLSVLPGILSYIWSKNILDFLLIFVHRNYQVYTFLPFAKEKIFDVKKNMHFCGSWSKLDKLSNFNGYPLRAAFYEYPPSIYKENGKWAGRQMEIFLLLTEMLNATSEIIYCPNANDTVAKLFSNEADIFLLKVFQIYYYNNVSFTYSYDMGDRVVMVPKASKIPPYQHIIYIFGADTWLMLLISIISLQTLYFIISYAFGLNLDYFIMILYPLVSTSIPNYSINKTKKKWLLLVWIYSSLVIGTIFQTSLTKSFIKPIYEESIKTIDDLRNSQMIIYIHPFLASIIPEKFGLKRKYSYMSVMEEIQHVRERNTSGAFVVSRQFAKYYINQNKKMYGDPIYEIMEEVLIPGSLVNLLQKTSPFLTKINRCLLLMRQHALRRKSIYGSVTPSEENILELSHFSVMFHMLFLGYLAGFVVLLLEKYWYTKRSPSISTLK